ncbi:hypothetical protein [Pseudonocardia sp. H11422]|uniref:hypothetical protein n=1 Tax=Pseudonocardia sp. H11422 TaxID=2835866 RepID=UPI001BDBEA87|nr:hypothetical protein [Pseudonocardia sp. H11422]
MGVAQTARTATTRVTTTATATPAPAPGAPSAAAAPSAASRAAGRTFTTLVTFYAAYDNDPPGSRAIAYPNARHSEAGGTGTYADPVTLAGDARELPVGTVVYYAPLRKYFVMEDMCASCIERWESSRTHHVDLWTGSATDSGVTACQEALTPAGPVTVELDPPAGRPVDTTPLYSGGRCITG